MKSTLEELRQSIKEERQYVDKKPYSHNIISLRLQQIFEDYGKVETNKAIKDFKLDKLGWRIIK